MVCVIENDNLKLYCVMDSLNDKIRILTEAARYDASCSSSGSDRKGDKFGSTSVGGICHSWSADGRCISLLKLLMSNECLYDCVYCANRKSNPIERATFTVKEVVDITVNFYRRNYIEGLFLSSGVCGNGESSMENMVQVAEVLRNKYKFGGYIHLKVIPGTRPDLIQRAGLYADRLSVNIELPSEKSLQILAPAKTKTRIFEPMKAIGEMHSNYKIERKKRKNPQRFAPAGHSTQMIVGASPENDCQILKLSEGLYNKFDLKRVYYSAYIPVNNDNLLPALNTPPLKREHRLYQADWLIRQYGFKADELLDDNCPNLSMDFDPKVQWALRNLHLFPVDVNRASYEMLLRVPGIGVRSAAKICKMRRSTIIREEDLKKLRIVMKRARYFLSINDKFLGPLSMNYDRLLIEMTNIETANNPKFYQPTLF